MNIAFKIIVFTFMLNLAAGIILFSIPDLPDQYTGVVSPLADQTQGQTEFIEGLGGNVSMPSTTASSTNVKDILLDSLFIGKIGKFVKSITNLLYGFPVMLKNSLLMFTPEQDGEAYITWITALHAVLVTVVSLAYGFGIFFLWTGKRLN